jgi:hypothetical protein
VVTLPTLLDEVSITPPNILDGLTSVYLNISNKFLLLPSYASYYSDVADRFDSPNCQVATSSEVAPFAPPVYVEGDLFETNLLCAPFELYLFRDLKNHNHGFKCDDLGLQPSVLKRSVSLDIPMAVSYITNDVTILRPGNLIFAEAFSKKELCVDLPLCLQFIVEHGTSNPAHGGIVLNAGKVEFGSRIDFGCAGSGSTQISPGVWRPDLICEIDVFNKVGDEKRNRINASLACIYDCIQVASDNIQNSIGRPPLFNYKPRDGVYGSTLRNFLKAKVMRNEWITLQVKCLSRHDQTDRHKDSKNCCCLCHNKTGGLCFIIVDCFGTYWSLKFLSNHRHVIGSYFNKLLGVKTLCIRAKNHFEKLDGAYAAFDEYDGSYKALGANVLSWKNPWTFFLDGRCHWKMHKDTGDNDTAFFCLQLLSVTSGCHPPSTLCVR